MALAEHPPARVAFRASGISEIITNKEREWDDIPDIPFPLKIDPSPSEGPEATFIRYVHAVLKWIGTDEGDALHGFYIHNQLEVQLPFLYSIIQSNRILDAPESYMDFKGCIKAISNSVPDKILAGAAWKLIEEFIFSLEGTPLQRVLKKYLRIAEGWQKGIISSLVDEEETDNPKWREFYEKRYDFPELEKGVDQELVDTVMDLIDRSIFNPHMRDYFKQVFGKYKLGKAFDAED